MSKTETQSVALMLADLLNYRRQFGYARIGDNCRFVEMDATLAASIESELRHLDAENKALRADAERYRWLRVQPDDCSAPRIDICHWTCEPGDSVNNGEGLRGDAADQAIDAARAAAKTGDAA